ncbi:hypothetical protein DMB66_59290 [Actinoplanes sp. ATCC 53533]|uniref:HIRAN domain-containing protein n=1 Tax=Actinoplanes sp. ATCC 53533 TaxID=1288362 RepID=UPI000F768447|nr:HIRAN domain-containing protein [Actinoplanes sp. ATCC 53533]RSM37915.1 hypothetical protein DMB66_59290 [Actinoplanes sp. ATCC 53533]
MDHRTVGGNPKDEVRGCPKQYILMMAIPFDLWGQRGYPHADVVGESHYTRAIRQLLGRDFKTDGTEIITTVSLMVDPSNKHDRNAVGVWAGGNLVGYLPREEAARYAPVLSQLKSQGWSPQVAARVWGAEWDDYDGRSKEFRGSVRLDLAEPHMLVPANLPPSGEHRLLPIGNAIQVTGEEKHLDALTSFLRAEGECWAYATLHEVVEQTARSSRTVVEVRLDGARVGQLTPKMSTELLPAIRHLAEQGATAAARAIVKGNRIKTEVALYTVKAHELPESWLGAQSPRQADLSPVAVTPDVEPAIPVVSGGRRDHGPIPPPPTGVRFVVPPTWPSPPAGWTPPAGWRPEPSWEPAPEGWQWWVPIWE